MANSDLSDGTLALRLITDHITECTDARKDTRNAIAALSRTIWGFAVGLLAYLIAFGSYYFIQTESLAAELQINRTQQAQAVREIPGKTAAAVSARLNPQSPGEP